MFEALLEEHCSFFVLNPEEDKGGRRCPRASRLVGYLPASVLTHLRLARPLPLDEEMLEVVSAQVSEEEAATAEEEEEKAAEQQLKAADGAQGGLPPQICPPPGSAFAHVRSFSSCSPSFRRRLGRQACAWH